LTGVNAYDLVGPEVARRRKHFADEVVRSGKPVRFEDRRGEIVLDNNVHPIFDEHGTVIKLAVYARNITEQRHAEKLLKESERKFRSLTEISNDCVWEVDTDLTYTYISPKVKETSGYEAEEYIGKRLTDFIPAEETDRLADFAGEIIESRLEFRDVEYMILDKDNKPKTLETSAIPVFDSNGDFTGYLGVDRDITQRKQAADALRESEERWRSLVENAPDIIITVNRAGEILFVNRTVSGLNVEDIMGTQLLDYIQPEYHELVAQSLERVLVTGNSDSYEIVGQGPNDTLSWYATHLGPIKRNGDVVSAILITRDITDKKRTEELLRQSEEKYRSLFEDSRDVVYITTPEGKVLDINSAGVELFGYASKEEHLNINIPEDSYVNPESRELFQREIARKGFVKDYELELKKKSGEKVIVLVTTNAVRDENGDIVAYHGIMHDVTERRRMEFQLQQSSKLAALGELAAGVAHEINNPLAAIDIQAGLIQDIIAEPPVGIPKTAREELEESVSAIETQIRRCQSITENLLSFARRPADKAELFDVNNLLRATVQFVVELTDKEPIIDLSLHHQLPLFRGNAPLLQQVFVNLLTNGFKAIEKGGSIAIGSHLNAQGNIVIAFRDSGHGISPEIRSRIFEPFFTTRPPGEGTGLGLSTSYYIIRQMGGTLEVESAPGEGTTFVIMLPMDYEPPEKADSLN
jgi:PAS domain S-box-containing protein